MVSSNPSSDTLSIDQRQVPVNQPIRMENSRISHPFGLTNPPEAVWAALGRMKQKMDGLEDRELVDAFSMSSGFYAEGTGLGELRVPKQTKALRCAYSRSRRK